jgi:UDP-4-amino-4-deoxy-L-arabinose-oxoglutarate aminotransferase
MAKVVEKVEFYRHALTEEDIAAVGEVLRSVFLTTGPKTAAFERALESYTGLRHVVGVQSCTTALFLCLKALGIGEGDEVITTPMTFIATANSILHTGAKPVLVDVEPETGNIDVQKVEAAITPKTRAVIPVHLYGLLADMKRLSEVCGRRGIPIVEDAAHALESERDGIRPGAIGRAVCYSFYATKNLTCGEGGAIGTNDDALDDTFRKLRLHGMSKGAADRYTGKYQHWDMEILGYNSNLTDIQSALMLNQIPRLNAQLARREAICQRYEAGFRGIPGLSFPIVPAGARSARHLFTIWVPPDRRDETLWRLQENGIGVAVNYRAIHLLTYYASELGFHRGSFPNAERIGDSTITLPLYPSLSDAHVDRVIEAVTSVAASWS